MFNSLSRKMKGEMYPILVRTFLARGGGALGGFLLIIAMGRLFGPTGVGVFALAQGVYLGAGILARYGMDNSLMRFVGQDYKSSAVKVYLCWALKKSLVLSVLAAAIVFVFRNHLASIFQAPILSVLLPGIAVSIPAFTLSFLLSGFMKGVRKPATACLLENGIISLIASCALLLMHTQWPGEIANAGWSMAIAAWLVLGQGVWQTLRWIKLNELHDDRCQITRMEFSTSSRAFFVLSIANFMQTVVSVFVAGWLLNSADLGLFKSVERTVLLINFILVVLNAVFPPRFATLYRQGNWVELNALARQGALVGVVLAFPMLLVCLLVPHWVLGFFGPDFIPAANLLRILAIAQLINVATGSVGFLLNMTGYEKLMRNIAITCNSLGLVMFLVLIPLLEALGAALALAFILVIQNLTALVFVWRKLGIWMLPIPNIISWVSIDSEFGHRK